MKMVLKLDDANNVCIINGEKENVPTHRTETLDQIRSIRENQS